MAEGDEQVAAGAEIAVGAPASPPDAELQLALRDVVQVRAAVAFASLPMIAFAGQPPELVLAVFLSRHADVDAELAAIAEGARAALEALSRDAVANGQAPPPALPVLPVSLARPLDGLAQAIVLTRTEFHVADANALLQARRPPRPWWRRLFGG